MLRGRDFLGKRFITNEGYEIEIIEYFDNTNCTIKFSDFTCNNRYNLSLKEIKQGEVKNYFHRSVFKIGFIGGDSYKPKNDKKCYDYWYSMLRRSYWKGYHASEKSYKDVTVCKEWHNFQNFAKWFTENYTPETMQGWQLDKDILQKGNKVYSPETCAFVPQEVNKLFTRRSACRGEYPIGVSNVRGSWYASINKGNGVEHLGTFRTAEDAFQAYKQAKEDYIREVADKWKGQITKQVYENMYNYKVEITD